MLRKNLYSIVLFCLLSVMSCANDTTSIDNNRTDTCKSDTDCDGQSVCNQGLQRCVSRILQLNAVEIWPPSGNNQGWVLQEFPTLTTNENGVAIVQLEETVSVQGRIYASHDTLTSVPAQVVAWRTSMLSGRPVVQQETNTSDSLYGKNEDEDYLLWLNKGHEYMFYVIPLTPFDTKYPVTAVPKVLMDDHRHLDLVLDGDDHVVEVRGRVLDSTSKPLPFGVKLRAYETGGWLRSTVARTCSADTNTPSFCIDANQGCGNSEACLGEFRFRVPHGYKNYSVKIESLPLPEKDYSIDSNEIIPLVPTIECTDVVLGLASSTPQTPGSPSPAPVQTLPTTIVLPSFEFAKMLTISVKASTSNAYDATGLSGIQIKFTTSLTMSSIKGFDNCTAKYEQSAITDSLGKVKIPLLLGSGGKNRMYEVMIVTPASSPYASRYIDQYPVGPQGGVVQDIVLEKRYEVSGSIMDADGHVVPSATLEAFGVALPSLNIGKLPPGKAITTTDAEGKFNLYMDPGTYSFQIRPADGSGLPSRLIESTQIDKTLKDIQFNLSDGHMFIGKVLTPTGAAASGFTVYAYDLVQQTTDSTEAISIARGITDSDGSFRFVVVSE